MALLRGVASLKWRYCHSDLVRHPAVLYVQISFSTVGGFQESERPSTDTGTR